MGRQLKLLDDQDDARLQWLGAISSLLWLLQDCGWALLFAPLAWPAVIAAICLEANNTRLEWPGASRVVRSHSVAVVFWLVGNAIWMLESSDDFGSSMPWKPRFNVEVWEGTGASIVRFARAAFLAGLALLVGCYVDFAMRYRREYRDLDSMPVQEAAAWSRDLRDLYRRVFIFPWMIKDLCWSFDLRRSTVCCAMVVVVLMVDYLRRTGFVVYISGLLWVIGNLLWAMAELQEVANLRLRFVSVIVMASASVSLGAMILGGYGGGGLTTGTAGWSVAFAGEDYRADRSWEDRPLIDPGQRSCEDDLDL